MRQLLGKTELHGKSGKPLRGAGTLTRGPTFTFSVPMTGITLVASKRDLMTTASLSAQLLVMFITLSLTSNVKKTSFYTELFSHSFHNFFTVWVMRLGGKTVLFEEFFATWVGLIAAHTMTTLVDPVVCLIFSKEYRESVSNLLKRGIIGGSRANRIHVATVARSRAAHSRSHLETRVERMKTNKFLVEQQSSQLKRF